MLKFNRSVNPVTKDNRFQRRHAVRAALFLLSTVLVGTPSAFAIEITGNAPLTCDIAREVGGAGTC